jgi:hypothetical protein
MAPVPWHDWLEVVKMKARTDEVWEYVDPSLAADMVERLVAPLKPSVIGHAGSLISQRASISLGGKGHYLT